MKVCEFSTFWQLFVNPAVSEHVSRAVMMVVNARDSVGACDSKTAHNGALFSCPVQYGVSRVTGELAVLEVTGRCKIASLEVGRVV